MVFLEDRNLRELFVELPEETRVESVFLRNFLDTIVKLQIKPVRECLDLISSKFK